MLVSGTHGYSAGGTTPTTAVEKYIFASSASGTAVLNLTIARRRGGYVSMDGYGYTSGGEGSPVTILTIDKFPFASDSDATDHGDLYAGRNDPGGQASTTDGYTSGGGSGAGTNVIQKWAFASNTTATDWADLTRSNNNVVGHSSTTYGYTIGGSPAINVIDKFSTSSQANATDVGNLFAGGYTPMTFMK